MKDDDDEIKDTINTLVNRDGFLTVAYALPKKINEIAPVAFTRPELGNLVILGPCSLTEFVSQWGSPPRGYLRNLYRAMID